MPSGWAASRNTISLCRRFSRMLPAVQAQDAFPPAECLQPGRRPGTGAPQPARPGARPGQPCLGHPGGGQDQGQAVRMSHDVTAGDVQGPQDLPGHRVVDRGRRAGPVLDRVPEVLRGEDLHLVVHGQGGARCVGAGVLLIPQRAFHEVHPLRPGPGGAVTFHPQQPAGRVGHRPQVLAVFGGAPDELPDERDNRGQRMLRPVAGQVRAGHGDGGIGVRIHVGGGGAHPGLGHDIAQPGGQVAERPAGQEGAVRPRDLAGPLPRVRADPGQPAVRHRPPRPMLLRR